MAALKAILGDTLLTESGVQPTEKVLAGKSAIGLYFSAHWCPPCRGFTPKLAEMYRDTFKGKGFEIIFVSSDKDQKSFDSYFEEMPWVALPFDQRDLKATLSKKYKVQGIPSFVILNTDGTLITTNGRDAVMKDPKGEKYPWTPPSAAERAKPCSRIWELIWWQRRKANQLACISQPIGVHHAEASLHSLPRCTKMV